MNSRDFHTLWHRLDLPRLTLVERQQRLEALLAPACQSFSERLNYNCLALPQNQFYCSYEVTVAGRYALAPLIFCSHHDYTAGVGLGIVDNWSGVVATLYLLEQAVARPFEHPAVFLFFCEEERGSQGSRYYVQHRLVQPPKIVVNLECLGPQPLAYAAENNPAPLPRQLPKSRNAGMPCDSTSFAQQGLPVVTFDGLSRQEPGFRSPIHSERDTRDAINPVWYRESLEYVERYARRLDAHATNAYRNRGRVAWPVAREIREDV